MQKTICALLLLLIATEVCPAQTLLRWKLKPGDAFTLTIHQETDSQVGFSGKQAKTKIMLDLRLAWKVTAVSDDGFTIRQTVDRIAETIATQDAGIIEFDSAGSVRPAGQGRELAEALKPLIGAEFDLAMSGRGIVSSVKPANDAAKALFASLEKGTLPNTTAQHSLEQLLRPSLFVLPEDQVAENATWSIDSDRSSAATLKTTYKLVKFADEDSKKVATIAISAQAVSKPGEKTQIKTHEQSGEILFAVDDGQIVEINQTQTLVTERPYRDTTITVTLNSTEKTTLTRPE